MQGPSTTGTTQHIMLRLVDLLLRHGADANWQDLEVGAGLILCVRAAGSRAPAGCSDLVILFGCDRRFQGWQQVQK